jgi:hypothetical protein
VTDLRTGMTATLERLRTVAEHSTAPAA